MKAYLKQEGCSFMSNNSTFENLNQLLGIMEKLRDPDRGCPWDQKQSFTSIVPFTLEEAYEVADTIERMDMDELPDELGDLLFQVVFYCQLGKEQGLFDFENVAGRISQKLIHRHPHVFGDLNNLSTDEVKANWEKLKAKERAQKAQFSLLDNIPLSLPSLSRAVKIQKRVAQVGFDWTETFQVTDKIQEELQEVMDEVNAKQVDQARVLDEVGDLLFAVVNLARHLKVDPEQALRHGNRKFEHRFRKIEQLVDASDKKIQDHSLDELESYWIQVKKME